MNKNIIVILAILILAFGCVGPPPVQQNTTNVTQVKMVALEDTVTLDYILRYSNGTFIETSIADVAKKEGTYGASTQYAPLTFKVAYNQGLIPGFVTGVLGMKVGETKEILIPPEQGYGTYDPKKYYAIALQYNTSKFDTVPRSLLESQGKKIEIGTVLKYDHDGMIVINDFDNETVYIEYFFSVGYEFRNNGFPYKVVNATNDTLFLNLTVKKGDSFPLKVDGTTVGYVRVTDVNETHAVFDENHPLAGETLFYTIIVKSISN